MKNSLSPASLVARSAAIMAALALLAILGALFVPDRAQAQAQVLVSNLGQTKTGQSALRNGDRLGQTFSIAPTGGASYYTLSSIEILFSTNGIAATDMGLLTVSLWSTHASGTNAGHPKNLLSTLTNPESVAADAAATFAAPADLTLAAGRTYVVVVVYSKTIAAADIADAPFWEYAGTGDDADPAPGWSIADLSHSSAAGATSWSETANRARKIRVNGTAVQPDVLVSNLGQTKTGQLILRNGDRSGQTFSIATTGEASYYTLSSIEILFSTNGIASTDMGLLTVSLWSIHASGANAGQPDSLLYTLTNPASVTADAAATFAAPADVRLAAGKTYAVVVVYSKTIAAADIADAPFWEYAGTGDDADPAPGWSIVDSSHQRPAGEASWEETANRAQKISVNGNETINNDPVFASTAETREVAENSAAGTNVGAVIPEATDADDDTLTYSMEGDDEASFDFDASTRQITTKTGVTYNYEATENTYSVTVTADDGNDGNATVAVTINLTDVAEKSAKPAKPTLAAVTGSLTSLNATWTKPGLNGGPEITGYNVQYKLSTASTWSDFAHSGTGVMATITGLTASMSYQVRVQAKNGETDSDWSDASDVLSTTSTPNAEAQDATITSLLSRLDVELRETEQHTASYDSHGAGYNTSINKVHGTLSPAGFNYPAGFGPWYTVEALVSSQEGPSGKAVSTGLNLVVRGQVTSVASSGTHRAHVLPSGASITLHLEGDDFSKSYSLESAELAARRTVTKCTPEGGIERHCMVGETANEDYGWDSNLPPRLTDGDSILVRLRYKAPRPGAPGTPTVTVPTGKSGALIVKWAAPSNTDPAVRSYQVQLTPAPVSTGAYGWFKSTGASTTRLPVLLLEPDTAYDVRVRARTALATGPWSNTARARTNPLQGTNRPQVTLDLNGVTKVKEGGSLPKRLKVMGMDNLHLGAFPEVLDGYDQSNFVEFRVLDGIADSFTYEQHPGGGSVGAFYAGALTIGEDGEVYHDKGYLVIPEGMSAYGPLYIWLGRAGTSPEDGSTVVNTGKVTIGSTERQCVEIADSSNNVPTDRTCPSAGMSGHAVDRLTARFVGVPRSHDGESEFTLRVAFIKDVGISPSSLREDALTVTGGTVTQAQRVDDRSDLFEITVEPDSDEDVSITLAAGSDCAVAGAICTEGEDPKKLYNSPTATVSGPTLTASFQGLPSQHDGETAFSFRIAFNDDIATGEEEFRDHSVEVWGGRVTRAQPVDQRRDLWEVEVEPASDDLVMISLRPSLSCDETGAVCTAGGRRLSVSPATMVAGPATWPVQVNGEAQVGKALTADTSNISDRFGVQVTSMTYQWLANNARIPGASGSTYTPGEGKRGKTISVMATYTDDRGNEDTLTSGPTDSVAARERNSRATGLPLISGRALVGQTLTADTSLIFDADGLENSVLSYLWEADDDSIPGATDPTYTPVQADLGKVITVIVSFLDDAGYGQSMTSPDTMAVTTAEAAAKVEFAHSLRYAANADGSVSLYWNAPDDEATGYRILRRRSSMGEPKLLVYVADTGSTATAYTDTDMTAGAPHNYRVQAISDSGLGERSDYIKVFPLRKAANSPATGAPAISGVAQVGETLRADTSGIVDADGLEHVTQNYLWGINKGLIIGAVYGYQWLADDAEIEDATGSTYILVDGDEGKAVKVRVSFTDDGGHRETLTSAATAAVTQPNTPATGLPTVNGKARVGETLTVDTSGISDENGLDDATFTHRWITDDSVVVGAGTRAYTPTGGDQGKAVKVRVSFTDDAGNWETRTSAQTAAVGARADNPGICDRTERVRDNIISLLNAQDLGSLGIKDCSEVTDEHLTRIRFLDLTGGGLGQKITSLKSGDFEGLSGMTELELADNSLSELPEGVFDGLSSLAILTMQGNDLSELPDGVFDDLTNLDALALYDNDLAALPDGVFDELTKLRTLAISDNKLTALPDGIFSGMSKLQTVNLSGNPGAPFTLRADLEQEDAGGVVVKVAEGAPFAMTVTLSAEGGTLSATTVVIGGGDTESASVTVTPSGSEAVTVSVDSVAFPDAGTVHDGIQTGVGESLTLEAAASGICDRTAQVRDAILARLDNVSDCANVTDTDLSYLILTLDLENSGITTLKSGDFDGLSRLNGINMSRNNLSALPDGVFDGLSRLQIINMNHNNLSALPDGVFDDLSRLFSIKLRRNNLSTLPDGVFNDLGDLQVLYLDANHLSELPAGVFDDLTNLVYLNLGQNGLSELPAGVFDELSNLVHLYLSFNNNPDPAVYPENTLDEDDLPAGAFGNLSKLRILDLSDNNLSVLPDGWFTGLTSLVNVKLIGNPGATFTVTAELKQNGADTVVVKVTQGAPFDMLVTLSAEGGTLATTTVTVESGSDSSGPVTVTPTGEGGTPVTVSVESVTFQNYQPEHTRGIQAGTGTSLTLNTPATGAPSISGTAQVGETLRTDTSDIEDANGLANATFSYRWVSSDGTTDTDIEKATDSTYKLVADDAGKTIKVIVTFADDAGNEETLTSTPTEPVTSAVTGPVFSDGPPGAPRNLTAAAGDQELTLSWDPPADNGNPPATRYRIEWRMDGKDYKKGHWGTSGSTTYTKTDLANGVKYVFRVKAENGNGNSYGPYGPASEEVSATPTSGSAVDLGTPVLSNTKTLHHGMVKLDWEDIEDAGWYVVQYYHVKSGEWLDLPAEGVDIAVHGSSAVVSNLHGLSWLRVRAMSCAGESEWSQIEELYGTKASDWEDVPVPEVAEGDQIEPCPVVLGTPVLSNTKTLHHGMLQLDWEDIEDAGWHVVQYYHVKSGEWLDLPAEGVDIAFHGSSAVVSNLHGLSWLRVRAMSCAGESEWSQTEELYGTKASDWEDVPVPEVAEGDEIEPCPEDVDTSDNSPATGAPTVSGTAQVGETLMADTSGIADEDGLENVAFSYQWLADDEAISGGTGSTYTLTDSEEGKTVKVRVSFTDDAGNGETLTSAATEAVSAAPTPNSPATGAPTISGTAQVGETLTAYTSEIVDEDGLSNVQYEYQWLADDTAIQGAADPTYTLAVADEGKAITVQVSLTDDAGNDETLTSAATDAVAAAEPSEPPAKPTGLSATASHDQVVLTWDDPGDDSITGYVILRRVRENDEGGEFSELAADTGEAATTYTDDTVAAGTTYTYRIKAINGHGVSERSRWFHIDTPAAPVPAKPTGLSATASHDQVVLTWDDPQDDSITGYVILRRHREDDPKGQFTELVADTGMAATTYTDASVAAETPYTYRIKAINEHGTSERSRWFHIDTPETPEGGPVVRFLSPPETISEDVTVPYYIAGDASGNEFISITTNTGFILSEHAETEIHCPIYFQLPGGNLELAPVVDGYVPTENGEQIYYRDGEPVTYNVDDSYMTMTKLKASTEGFYLRNCAAEPMDGYVGVTTYRDDDVYHLSRIRITQPSPFEITTGAPPD